MASTVARGNYYKTKTKKWFISQGYACEYTEQLQTIFTPVGLRYRKLDLWGADGVAMNGQEIIFWNSKLIATKNSEQSISEGKREFAKYPYPKSVKRRIIVWRPRARYPEIYECS